MEEKLEELMSLAIKCDLLGYSYNSCFKYFDFSSRKNIDKKIEVLTKLSKGIKLEKEEYFSREVFELMPDNAEEILRV